MTEHAPERSPQPEPDDGRTPFQRFEDTLRKVVAVPKTEVEKRQQKNR